MEKMKVTISIKMAKGIKDSLCNYNGDKDQLVFDYLSGKSRGYLNDKIDPIVLDLSNNEFAGIVWDLVDVEVVETNGEKKEKWKGIISELKESELPGERKGGDLVERALKDFGIL